MMMKHNEILLALWRAAGDSIDGWGGRNDLAADLGWHPLDAEHELGVLEGLKLITKSGHYSGLHGDYYGDGWDSWLYFLTEAGLVEARRLAESKPARPEPRPEPQYQSDLDRCCLEWVKRDGLFKNREDFLKHWDDTTGRFYTISQLKSGLVDLSKRGIIEKINRRWRLKSPP